MFAPAANLKLSSRFPALPRTVDRISPLEIVVLLTFGGLAALAVCTLHISLRVPGHAILRAVIPMAAGLALVPRHTAGLVMATGAIVVTALLRTSGVGEIQSAAFVSLVALGPLLDLAVAGTSLGWKLYARFAIAGATANLLAFVARYALAFLISRGGGNVMGGGMGNGMGGGNGTGGGFGGGLPPQLAGGHDFLTFWPMALASFLLCGAIAGLISAALWFRLSADRPT